MDTAYYLDDAGTYASGETGFVANTAVTDGNGYIKITLVEEKVDVNKTATRWKNIEDLLTNGTFDYNGKTITETDTENNVITHSQTN